MNDVGPLSYPHYVRLADLVWFEAQPLAMWRHIVEREDDVQDQIMRLAQQPKMEEHFNWDTYMEWRKQVADGKLTIDQLRHLMLQKYDRRFVDGTLDRALNSYLYPSLKAVRRWHSLHILLTPDGVTEEFVYEYRSVAEPQHIARQAEAMRALAQMEAFLLDRPAIQVQVRARLNDEVQSINQPLDITLARDYLTAAEAGIIELSTTINHQSLATRSKHALIRPTGHSY